jgi:hypothetical protein
MTFTLHRLPLFIPSAADADRWADICATAAPPPKARGRPRGSQPQRRPIDLPGGDRLVPYFTTFAESTGLHPKTLQRMRHKLPCVDIGGGCYVRDRAARAILAAPAKPRRGRLR